MEIRARIALEVAKFQANAKVVAAQFRAMSGSAERFQNNVDHYAKRSLDNTKSINEQRVKNTDKMGQAIVAREKKIADDAYSARMQYVKRYEKDKTKLELEAVRKGSDGTITGSVRPPAKSRPVSDNEAKASGIITAQMRRDWEKAYAAKEKAAIKAERLAQKEAAATQKAQEKHLKSIERQNAIANRQLQKHYKDAAREVIRTAAIAEKEGKKLALQNYFRSDEFERKLASTRYALYDIGQRAIAFGTAVAAGMAMAIKSAIQFESAFTSVERTTRLDINSNIPEVRAQAELLRASLIQMTTEIPVAFQDITQIATLGAQLGIATENIEDFTSTVAKFSAITKISVDDVSLSFGRLSQLLNVPASQFENLSSAVAFAGINAVATDQEILRMSESIAAASTQAGIAAADTIGFATALASLKVRPEEARGVLTRLFREFDLSVAQGGSRLDDLGRVVGRTSEQTAQLWNQNPSEFVKAFLNGAKASGALNETITALGITNTRELNVITRLAENMNVLTSSIADANEQFELGTYSNEAYGKVADDLASKIIMMQNALAALGASLGETVAPVIGFIVDQITAFAKSLTEASPPIKILIATVAALTAGAALFFGSLAFGIAGLLAMRLAFDNLKGSTVQAGLGINTFRQLLISMMPAATGARTITQALGAQMAATKASIDATSVSVKGLTFSMAALNRAMGIIGLVLSVGTAVWAMAESQQAASKAAEENARANFEAAGGLQAFIDASKSGAKNGSTIYGSITASVSNLTEEQIEARKKTDAERVARLALSKETKEGKKAYEDALAAQKAFNDEVERGIGLTSQSTINLNEDTKAVIANALAKITVEGEDQPLNIYSTIAEMPDSVRARLEKNGVDAVALLNGAMEASMSGNMTAVDYLHGEMVKIAESDPWGTAFDADWKSFVNDIYPAAQAIDGIRTTAEKSAASGAILDKMLGTTGVAADDLEGEAIDLNDVLRQTVNLLTSDALAENKVVDALNTFATGAEGTSGELEGMGKAARENLGNFASFMQAATDAAIEAGEGTPGAVKRIIGGLKALEQQGFDTGDAFNVAKNLIVSSIASTINADAALRESLAKETSLAGIEKAIRAFYELKIAAASTPQEVAKFREQMNAALASLAGVEYTIDNIEIDVKGSSGAVKTALEKLQQMIEKAFRGMNIDLSLRDSMANFGAGVNKNGNTFSKFTEAGRSNISALQDVIDNLAVKSGGDVQKFANDLASLRGALVQAGVPASGLKVIDTAIKATGKSGKSSKKDIEKFADAMAQLSETKTGILALKEAADNLASSIKNNLNATFAGIDAADNVTLGWIEMANAAEAAQKQIDDATRAIASANAEIGKLTADKGKLEYQLKIALKYGDSLRANEIRAEIAAINSSIAEQSSTIAENNAQIAEGNSALGRGGTAQDPAATIERSRSLRDMAGRYADLASWQLVNAKKGDDLNKIIDDQVDKFKNNALQMGYTEEEAGRVAGILRTELIASIDDIPKDIGITIDADTKAALKSVESFSKKATDALDKIPTTITTKWQVIEEGTSKMPTRNGYYPGEISGGYKWDAKTNKWAKLAFANGGLVPGTGGPTQDNIPAMLSSGEYVVRASAVSAYGLDFMNALNQQRVAPSRSMAVGAAGGSGSQLVYLSPEDRQLLRAAIDRPIALYTDNATIAKSANAGNALLAQRGLN